MEGEVLSGDRSSHRTTHVLWDSEKALCSAPNSTAHPTGMVGGEARTPSQL